MVLNLIYLFTCISIYHMWWMPDKTLIWVLAGLIMSMFFISDKIKEHSEATVRSFPQSAGSLRKMMQINLDIKPWVTWGFICSFALVAISTYGFLAVPSKPANQNNVTVANSPPSSSSVVPKADPKVTLIAESKALAGKLGEIYGVTLTCNNPMESVSPPKVAGMYINYMTEQEVQEVMNVYAAAMEKGKSEGCNPPGFKDSVNDMLKETGQYIIKEQPFMKPQDQR